MLIIIWGMGSYTRKSCIFFIKSPRAFSGRKQYFFFRTPLILSILNCVKVKYLYLGKLAFCYWVIVRKLRPTGFNPALELVKCEISDTVFSFYLNFLITINTFINSMVIKHICDVLLTVSPPQWRNRGTVMRFMNSEIKSQDMNQSL